MSTVWQHIDVRVTGTVQGVGFRPTVYRLALACGLNGEVLNDSDGVLIRLVGAPHDLRDFLHRLPNEAPPLAKIDSIAATESADAREYHGFHIADSRHAAGRTDVAADAAVCQACLDEISDPQQRRYLYPFTNCTHCGPRLSIVRGIPYDRPTTTMAAFAMCPECAREYGDPLDRRFHAQPIACHACGPTLTLHEHGIPLQFDTHSHSRETVARQLQHLCHALTAGKIVALKGLGGFHLCCDATRREAVVTLRKRKAREAKPFALMAADVSEVRRYCHVSPLEEQLLGSSAAPIVLLHVHNEFAPECPALADAIAPDSRLLGFMLPYTPLHYLLCRKFGRPLVMTSGNASGEPQLIDNVDALSKLDGIADLIATHNRDIANRIDDSVLRVVAGQSRLLRRARGYAPRSITLPKGFEQADGILAYGAELKSTFCLVKQGAAILSQHQGDLEEVNTYEDYERNLILYHQLFDFTPRHHAYDLHPEYLSSKLARSEPRVSAIAVQHHHAHIACAMAENGLARTHRPVLGIAFDGLGMGDDGSLWGGEFLLADYAGYHRLACLKPIAMLGGGLAARQPWRNSLTQLLACMAWEDFTARYGDTELGRMLRAKPISTLRAMLREGINCPLASSAGRLFDAVAGALDLHAEQAQFEGQAAIALEMLADRSTLKTCLAVATKHHGEDYRLHIVPHVTPRILDPGSIWPRLCEDLLHGVPPAIIAARFHAGLILGIADMIEHLRGEHDFDEVVLSGGCMQNALLLEGLIDTLTNRGLRCLTHTLVPANDGGIALGQAVIAAARMAGQSSSAASIPYLHA
ncbi:carbamoyltransferase HypF [Dyella sp. M7H15-1]|uniref:carbamoyltransferase HypF n=1 Tax=Dyella sp. M7H15-1 TaxID=2501295 RepID=UPI001004EEAB|nr:carbamoyltransferase HypF [Dyella sp. M7H15-1]QAU23171.1 carbamoyltransferase HypF [Dyella sp. M7H15-1]